MYTMMSDSSGLTVQIGGTTVLQNIRLSVHTNRAAELILKPEAGTHESGDTGKELVVPFTDESETIRAELRFVPEEGSLVVKVAAKITNKNGFGSQQMFLADGAVRLLIDDLPGLTRLMANYRHKDWWTRPYTDPNWKALPERTQSLLWRTDSRYFQLLTVSGGVYKTDLYGTGDGAALKVFTGQGGHSSCETVACVLAHGTSPFGLPEAAVRAAARHIPQRVPLRQERRYPEALEYMGWCSWDAFYHAVDEKGLMEKAEEFRKMALPVRWFMIDDGWLDVKDGGLNAFDADHAKFPQGLTRTVDRLKEEFGIRWVGVWHTILGYWGGVNPNSEIGLRLREYLVKAGNGVLLPAPDAVKGFGFWNAWHEALRSFGIEMVKVDGQSAIGNVLIGQRPLAEAANGAHTALEASVSLHFDQTLINCMGMGSENIWGRPTTSISRNSDDFMPTEEGWFAEHALQNAYNSYYHGAFYWGDWDMFWTDHKEARAHALLRALSGGPVYFSDALGRTNPEVVRPLMLSDGRLLRFAEPGLPTEDCLLRSPVDEPVPLKLWNTGGGAGVVAAFHIYKGEEPLEGAVSPSDVPGLAGERFAVVDVLGRTVSLVDAGGQVPFQLEKNGYALYAVTPVEDGAAVIGLLDKYAPALAVKRTVRSADRITTTLAEGGEFAFVAAKQPAKVLVNGAEASVTNIGGELYAVDCRDLTGEEVIVEIVLK